MVKLLIAALFAVNASAATLVVTPSAPGRGTVQVSGLVNPSYFNPYFILMYVAGQGSTAAAFSVNIGQAGQACGGPTHCEIINDGSWDASWFGVPQGPYTLFAALYDGTGPAGTPNTNPASLGGWQSAGRLLAVSAPIPLNLPAPPPVQPTGGNCSAASITYAQCLTNNADQWCIAAAPRGEVTLNGSSAAGVWGSQVLCDASGIAFINQDNGSKQCWTGSAWRNC